MVRSDAYVVTAFLSSLLCLLCDHIFIVCHSPFVSSQSFLEVVKIIVHLPPTPFYCPCDNAVPSSLLEERKTHHWESLASYASRLDTWA
ncbi:uncharacterized protein BT62DRAFT_937285 [Guyanagaster necrorhizus]|uniref:Uncharacterized protein n=1 Tax=Guyanagaster necrorhizus TaxID=856835 RepID=A0A9P7VIJ7_9AGAR|nr:uncharacterized protein BT62DRAFT_937285 [Guyanagaster necrorhizus MCA 3950]KAG7441233.1 hypothetical protein BT62DRAFT_937285 [Guyanagaster necrorhizus MCA 3950]